MIHILSLAMMLSLIPGCDQPGTGNIDASLEASFAVPPDSVKVYTWWHWINGNVTREGITKDLEAMKKAGVGDGYCSTADFFNRRNSHR